MFKDGKQTKWKGLPEVWEHVGDKAVFVAFVQRSLREFLGEPRLAPAAAPNPVRLSLDPPERSAPMPNPVRPPADSAQPVLPLPE